MAESGSKPKGEALIGGRSAPRPIARPAVTVAVTGRVRAEDQLKRLLVAPLIDRPGLKAVPKRQGVYVLWLRRSKPVCLKVGIAANLNRRLEYHFSSHVANSVLARHLYADSDSSWCRGGLLDRDRRRRFLSARCYFQAIEIPRVSRETLLKFEKFLIKRLQPVYVGRVRGNPA